MSGGSGKKNKGICPVCGKEFVKREKSVIYCGRACAGVAKRAPAKTCPVCGVKIPGGSSKAKYCSEVCRGVAKKCRAAKREKTGNEEKVLYDHVCQWCKKEFRNRYPDSKYCSKTCNDRDKTKLRKDEDRKVQIRIREPLANVFPKLQPVLGKAYDAVKFQTKQGSGYIIPEIGQFGLIVRRGECEEI